MNKNNFQDHDDKIVSETLMTAFEIPYQNLWHRTFDRVTGFFEAPLDGRYRFHAACDDQCQLYLSVTTPLDPAAKELLLDRANGDYGFRSFDEKDYDNDYVPPPGEVGDVFSAWQTLTKGQRYYIEAHHQEWWGNEHLTVGVEIEPSVEADVAPNHPQMAAQHQLLKVTTDLSRDTAILTIDRMDPSEVGKEYKVWLTHPTNPKIEIGSDKIKAGCPAADLAAALTSFYKNVTGTGPTVTLACSGGAAADPTSCAEVRD